MKDLKTKPKASLEGVTAEIFRLPCQNISRGEFIMSSPGYVNYQRMAACNRATVRKWAAALQ